MAVLQVLPVLILALASLQVRFIALYATLTLQSSCFRPLAVLVDADLKT